MTGGFVYPASVVTREIEVGPVSDLTTGIPYAIRVVIEPSRSLILDDEPVISSMKVFTIPAGVKGTLALPTTDQPGYRDSNGNLVPLSSGEHAFYYKIKVFCLRGGAVVRTLAEKKGVLPGGSTPVDIDNMLQFDAPKMGGVISVPDDWSSRVSAVEVLAQQAVDAVAELGGDVSAAVNDWFEANPNSVVSPGVLESAITAHADSPEPHKAYDIDMPTLSLIFKNGLV